MFPNKTSSLHCCDESSASDFVLLLLLWEEEEGSCGGRRVPEARQPHAAVVLSALLKCFLLLQCHLLALGSAAVSGECGAGAVLCSP